MKSEEGAHALFLEPFGPLLQQSSDDKSRSWTGKERFEAVRAIRQKLDGLLDTEQSSIASAVNASHPTISSHIHSSQALKRKLEEATVSLDSLENNLSNAAQSLEPVISLLMTRSSLTQTCHLSRAHLEAYSLLSGRSKRLLELEEAIVQGRGTEDVVVKKLLDECGGMSNDGDKLVSRARVWSQLDRRTEHLRSTLSAQLNDAFDRSFSFSTAGPNLAAVVILTDTQLFLPPGARLKLSSSAASDEPEVSLPNVLHALHSLNLLRPALTILCKRLVKTLLQPLIAAGGGLAITTHPLKSGVKIELTKGESNLGGTNGLCESLGLFSRTWKAVVDVEEEFGKGDFSETVAEFTANLHLTILKSSIDTFLLPRLPTEVSFDQKGSEQLIFDLRLWVSDIFSFVTLEKHLSTLSTATRTLEPWATEDIPRYELVSRFYDNEAGLLWANKQKQAIVERARKLIAGGWEGWREIRVERVPILAPLMLEEKGRYMEELVNVDPHVKSVKAASHEEDGWAFDHDWNEEESAKNGRSEAVAVPAPGIDESGWSFDEDLDIESKADSSPNVSKPAKPVREARKIGKKGKSNKESEAANPVAPVDSIASPVQADSPLSFHPSATAEETTWSTMPAEEPASGPVASHPLRPAVETCAVSRACSNLLRFVEDGLRIASLNIYTDLSSPSFHNIAPILQLGATETLDIYRALMPVVHVKEVEDVPALAMQFANDCEELALHAKEFQVKFAWNAKGAESRLEALSKTVQDRQIETQRETLIESLSGANGFVNTSHDMTFEKATKVVEQAIHQLHMLHRQWKPVMRESACLQGSGILMEAFVCKITNDILALDDITANESERLDQLCKMLYPLEELFTSHHGSRIVEYVPHWLKFCYISELLTGSLVDITYLLENGALVDFTQSELVHILVALFSDTPKRAAIIDKIWSTASEEPAS